MDEERFSRPHMQAAPPTRAAGIPEQRSPDAPAPEVRIRPVMSLARITLAVIFAMLFFGLVMSFILTRA